MKKIVLTLILLPLLLGIRANGENAEVAASLTPNPRMVTYQWMSLSKWYAMHAEDVALATEGKAPLIFIGDSITEAWNGSLSWI